jgi:hypothetical protein
MAQMLADTLKELKHSEIVGKGLRRRFLRKCL